jgi:hypothetical protein
MDLWASREHIPPYWYVLSGNIIGISEESEVQALKIIFAVMVLAAVSFADPAIIHTIDAPDTGISGLGYGNGSLWMVDGTTEYAYQVDPADGTVQSSWYCANTTKVPTGVTFANNTVYIAMVNPPGGTAGYCYRYSTSGSLLSSFSLDC